MRFAAAAIFIALSVTPVLADGSVAVPTAKPTPEAARAARLDSLLGRLHKAPVDQNTSALEAEIWEILSRNRSATAEVFLQESTAAINAGELATAGEILSQLTESYPKFAAGWSRRAFLYHLQGRPDAALMDIDHAIAIEPRDYMSLALKGLILADLKRNDEAIEALKQALEINPHMPSVEDVIKRLGNEAPHV